MFVKHFCPFKGPIICVNKIKIVASNCNKISKIVYAQCTSPHPIVQVRNRFFSADLTTGSACEICCIIFPDVYVWCIFGLVICASTAAAVAANSSGSSAVAIVQQHKQAAVDQVNGDRRRRASIKLCE